MIRGILKALAIFDWITPLEIVTHGGAKIMLPEGAGFSGGDAVNILRKNGIASHGYMVVNGHYMFYVDDRDRARAVSILKKKGVPVV